MSYCTFIASDSPLREAAPQKAYPLVINLDEGTVFDGGADDNFYLHAFRTVPSCTDKKYGVCLEWQYTDGRAKKLLEYIENALEYDAAIEIWRVWLMDYYEYEESPVIRKCTVPFSELTIDDIKEIDLAEVWNSPDKRYPNRPSFYCLTITQEEDPVL